MLKDNVFKKLPDKAVEETSSTDYKQHWSTDWEKNSLTAALQRRTGGFGE